MPLPPPPPPYRERRVLFPLGVFVGICATMLFDAIWHAALYQPPWRTEPVALHEMIRMAVDRSNPVALPHDLFHVPGGP